MPIKKVIRQAAFFAGLRALSLCLLFLFAAALPLRADLRFDPFLGYDGILPENSWFPITCEIYNDEPAFTGTIEISGQDFGGGQVRRMVVDLPTGTRKRVTIPAFGVARNWPVRLFDERGKLRSEQVLQPTHVMKPKTPLIAALTRTVNGLPTMPESETFITDSSKYPVARLQANLFPDNPLVLEGIDVMFLSSEKAIELGVGQVNALVAWMQRGGHLIIGVEQLTDINGTPWLRDLLPATLTTVVNLSTHEALQQFARDAVPGNYRGTLSPAGTADVTATSDVQFDAAPIAVAKGTIRDGTVMIGDAANPLAIDAPRGRGRITLLTFSPEREPFISWKNKAWFWKGIADVPANVFLRGAGGAPVENHLSSDGIFSAMIQTTQVRKLPLGWLLALLVAYLVVIGPLDQCWLKKINRQMLTWITFPCYVVFFSALIYFIGFHLRAGELEWNEMDIVDILPDSSDDDAVFRGQTYVSIYSPNNADYDIAGNLKFTALRGQSAGNFGGKPDNSHANIEQVGNNFKAQAHVAVWTSELFVTDWFQKSTTPATMTINQSATGWNVTITNDFGRVLSDARAVVNGRIYTLGELAVGQSKTFHLNEGEGTSLANFAQGYSQGFHQAVQSLNSSFGNNVNPIPNAHEAAVAASFITYVNNANAQDSWNTFGCPAGLDMSRYAGERHVLDRASHYAILLAWDKDHSPTALNQFNPKRLHRDTLYRLVVPLKM